MTLSKSGRSRISFHLLLMRQASLAQKDSLHKRVQIAIAGLPKSSNDLISTTFRTTARSYNEVGKYAAPECVGFDSEAPGTVRCC